MYIADRLEYLTEEDFLALSDQERFELMPIYRFEGFEQYSDGSSRFVK